MNFTKLTAILVASLLFSPLASAMTPLVGGDTDVQAQVRAIFESDTQAVKLLSSVMANERVNVYVQGSGTYGVVTSGGRIASMQQGALDNPTMNVYSDADTVNAIANGQLSVDAALSQGKIRYEGVGFISSLKLDLASFGFDIYSFFKGFFG